MASGKLLIIASAFVSLAWGCASDPPTNWTNAEHFEYIHNEINAADLRRLRQDHAKALESKVASLVLEDENVASCEIRLLSPEYCIGEVSADEPYYCFALIQLKNVNQHSNTTWLLYDAFESENMLLTGPWVWPLGGKSEKREALTWYVEDKLVALDAALVHPIGSKPSFVDSIGFQPVEVDSNAQNP
ncbi:MAG: hypothetical protein AAGA25_03485 [Planctomycetota bacterium]